MQLPLLLTLQKPDHEYKIAKLGFSPFENEKSQYVKIYYAFLLLLLRFCNRSRDNAMVLTGDNCCTNLKPARISKRGYMGCENNRMSLAVQEKIVKHSEIIQKLREFIFS